VKPDDHDGARLEPWSLVYEAFDPRHEGQREALCALGNGYFVTRGAVPWAGEDRPHYPGTYRAGLYDFATSTVDGAPLEHEDLVNLPNWLRLDLRIDDGEWFDLRRVTVLGFRQELDLRRGVLTRTIRFEAEGRRATLSERRFVHLVESHLAGMHVTLEPEEWGGVVHVRSSIDGRVANHNADEYHGADGEHLVDFAAVAGSGGLVSLRARTRRSRVEVALAARTRILVEAGSAGELEVCGERPREIGVEARCEVRPGGRIEVEKIVALYTGQDIAVRAPQDTATRAATDAADFTALLASHERAWAALWDRFTITVDDQQATTTALRLHLFHILQTLSSHTAEIDVGVPGRGWHGEGYRGHVFWDELFIFPALGFRLPELVRALLLYRYSRLPEARRAAREAGLRGAMFPWRSASDGREVTDRRRKNPRSGRWIADNSRLQRHIGAAIAYNVWHYYEITGDVEFLAEHGAEMLVEIARFWASAASLDEARGRYVIRGVVGPDEFHDGYPDAAQPGLDNNAYTNIMAVWSLLRARDALRVLPGEARGVLERRLDLGPDELVRWEDITRRMFVPFHGDGLISQFEGYEALAEFDWDGYKAKYGDIHRLDDILEAEGDSPNRYKISKQADVLMLFFVLSPAELRAILAGLGYPWDETSIARNTRYYERQTSHGSTLSRVVHAWVLARCDRGHSWSMLREALGSDLGDIQGGTTAEGVHLGAMAGTFDIFQRCYTGLETREDTLWLAPALPPELRRVAFRIRYRGAWLALDVGRDRVQINVDDDAPGPVPLRIAGRDERLAPGTTREFAVARDEDERHDR
jgi:trehalose/maltose hydrolase-like predicted phosphorylase